MAESLIERRLRRGLADAADALPEPEPTRRPISLKHKRGSGHHPHRQRKWTVVTGIAAATILIAGVGAAVRLADRGEEAPVAVADEPKADQQPDADTPTTIPADQVRTTNGRVPGEAVAAGDEIRLYGPDGAQTGSVSIAPLKNARSASSDLDGGWVVCGDDGEARLPNDMYDDLPKDLPLVIPNKLIWFPAEGEPVVLEAIAECVGGFQVIDSVYGPMLVRNVRWFRDDNGHLQGTVLATGERHDLPAVGGGFTWSAASNRLLVSAGGDAHLYDLTTGEELPIAEIGVSEWSDFSLSPDAKSIAIADGPVGGLVDLTIYDLQTGEQVYRDSFPLDAEDLQLSYDGTKVAVGSYSPDVGPVTVVDLESGNRHTIDAYGPLL